MNAENRKTAKWVVLFVIFAYASASCSGRPSQESISSSNLDAASSPAPQIAGGFADIVATVAQNTRPSVVHISISGTVLQQVPTMGPFGTTGPPTPQRVPFQALGSGMLIDAQGHVITNNHVVANADTIEVVFYDGTRETAKLVGQDSFTDIAVLKVNNRSNIPPIAFGDSDSLRVGEWVVAIGNPEGLDWTVTAGIVSATHRTDVGPAGVAGFEDFIQTDAAINPGNSGGPLLNLNGEVVGVNSMIVSQSSGSEGLGLAIPSKLVQRIIESLIRTGKVVRGELGVNFQNLNEQIIKGLNLPANIQGVVIVEAIPNTPGAEAGLAQGDVITQFDGTKITSAYRLRSVMSQTKPGTQVSLSVLRSGRTIQLKVKLMDLEDLVNLEKAHPAYELLGIQADMISSAAAKALGLPQVMGVAVNDVVAGSPADQAGVAKGDIIFQVGSTNVTSMQQFSDLIGTAIQTGTVIVLLRDGKSGQMGYLQISVG